MALASYSLILILNGDVGDVVGQGVEVSSLEELVERNQLESSCTSSTEGSRRRRIGKQSSCLLSNGELLLVVGHREAIVGRNTGSGQNSAGNEAAEGSGEEGLMGDHVDALEYSLKNPWRLLE